MSLRTLHVSYSYPPDPPGGTEIYVAALCRELAAQGVGSIVAAPAERDASYEVEGVSVRRFQHSPSLRGLPVVFTYHTPTASCLRGTMLLWGHDACDGHLDAARCTACTLESRGTGRLLALTLAAMPPAGGEWITRMGWHGPACTAMRMSSLVRRQHDAFRTFLDLVDRIVILSPWVESVLSRNGVTPSKMVRSAHGMAIPGGLHRRGKRETDRVRIIHLGRTDPVKGTDILINALRALPHAAIDLDIFGIVQDAASSSTYEHLKQLAAGDARIQFLPPIPHDEVIPTIAKYHCMAVPSQWMETGPLVVLESFVAGVPVLASALGGLADKVTDEVDGLLVRPFDDVAAWTAALRRYSTDRDLANRLTASVRRPRSFSEVGEEMRLVYDALHATRSRSSVARAPRAITFGNPVASRPTA